MDKLTTDQKQKYDAIKALHDTVKGVVPPPPNPMNNPRYRVWMWLYLQGRSQTIQQITRAVHYEQALVFLVLNELVAAGRVAHDGNHWWVVSLTFHPIIE